MEPVKAEKQFNRFISVVYALSFIPIVIAVLGGLGAIAGIVLVIALPDSFLDWMQRVPLGEFTIQLQEIGVMTGSITEDLVINKMPLILLILSSIVIIVIILCMLIFINRWLHHLKNGRFFDANNSRYIEYVGYSIIVLGLWYGVQEMAGSFVKVNFFESNPAILDSLSSTTIEAGGLLTYSFTIDIALIFIGVLVWIIGRVFKYGTYLQNEYDQTV